MENAGIFNNYFDKLDSLNLKKSRQNIKDKFQNVLLINRFDKIGGASILSNRILKFLNSNGYNSKLLVNVIKSQSPETGIEKIKNFESVMENELTTFGNKNGLLDIFHYSSFNLKNSKDFINTDIVHFHNLHKEYFSFTAIPEISHLKPVIWTLHDMYSFTGHCVNSYGCQRWKEGCGHCPDLTREVKINKDTTNLLWKLKKIVYQFSDISIVAPSKWIASHLKKSILKDKEVTLIHNGVDEQVFFNHEKLKARQKLSLPADKFILLFVANGGIHNRTKGGYMIKEILERLKLNNVTMICIGQKKNENPNIKSIPYIEDESQLSLYFSAADLFLHPTHADNCPLVVLESLSCGTPVVSFKTGGMPELIIHKKNGYLAKNKCVENLVAGINYFIKNKRAYKKAMNNSRSTVLKNFTMNIMMDKYIQLYNSKFENFNKNISKVDPNYKIEISKLLMEFNQQIN